MPFLEGGIWESDPAWDQQEPPDYDDWDDVIAAEELGLDEPRCPKCGVPSTGLCVDCDPAVDDHDRRFSEVYDGRTDIGDDSLPPF